MGNLEELLREAVVLGVEVRLSRISVGWKVRVAHESLAQEVELVDSADVMRVLVDTLTFVNSVVRSQVILCGAI